MSKSFLSVRIEQLKVTGRYSNELLSKLDDIISKNDYKLPREFYISDVGIATLNSLLEDLEVDLKRVSITAPKGSNDSTRQILIR